LNNGIAMPEGTRFVSQPRQSTGPGSEPDGPDFPRRLDNRNAVRLLRRPGTGVIAVSLGLLALGGLGFGALRVDPARTAGALDDLSAAWHQLLVTVHLGAAPEPAVVTVSPALGTGMAPPARLAPPADGLSAIAYGDRLKITFFESVGVDLGGRSSVPDSLALNAIFPRMDLSGEYVVDEAGGVDIPRLGRLAAAGQGVGALETQLANAFRRALGRPSDVHIAVLDRQPVYILGGARGGATIRHAPGLIVMQALAEAGGYQGSASDPSRAIEAIRETQRLGEAKDRLVHALVRQARLAALRDGLSAVVPTPVVTARLADILKQNAIAGLLRDADATLGMERQAYDGQLALADRLVGITKGEVAAQNQRVAQARVLAQNKAARLHDLAAIAAHGSVSQFKITDATMEVAEAAAKQDDLLVAVAQAESRLAEAEIARARIVQAHTTQVALDLATADQAVADLTRAVASMRAVVAVLGGRPAQADPDVSAPMLRIVRRGPDGMLVIPATETTPLRPGDVLRIDPAEPAGRQVAANANP
jgi:exopolysaccharide production protein ExoF